MTDVALNSIDLLPKISGTFAIATPLQPCGSFSGKLHLGTAPVRHREIGTGVFSA
jgi:hypothetical protein